MPRRAAAALRLAIAAAFVVLFTAYGAQYCFGVFFFTALLEEFRWSRASLGGNLCNSSPAGDSGRPLIATANRLRRRAGPPQELRAFFRPYRAQSSD